MPNEMDSLRVRNITGSKIFEAYRALGLYSSHVAHCVRYHKKHKEHYVIVAVGNVFHTYNCSKLGITQVSNSHPDEISCIATDRYLVFTGCKNIIRAFRHNRQVIYTYEGHKDDILLILPFADHLITVDKSSNLKIWHIFTKELYLDIDFDKSLFDISAIIHPTTYVNKVLLGSKQGTMQLWNIRKNKMLYEFSNADDSSSIVCLAQAPAVDVIAVGRTSGSITIRNIRVDEVIMKFNQDSGPVIGIAFRTDGPPTMVTAGTKGHLSVWDLEEKRILGLMEHAHSKLIAGITFLNTQPLLVTNSADNSIKMWAFDQSDGKGRLLRLRSGHSAPLTKIRFYDEDGENIISTALDSTMRSFSTIHEEKNKSFGQASMNRSLARKKAVRFDEYKLPPILDFTSQMARASDWDNIIAFHHKHEVATTWNYQKCRMGSYKLQHDRFRFSTTNKENDVAKKTMKLFLNCYVSAVSMTECGNFCFVGYNTGHLDVYNLQSGIHRGSYVDPDQTALMRAHKKAIVGVAVDGLNQVVLTTGLDKNLKFWRFKSKELIHTTELDALPAKINLHRESSMVALVLDNFSTAIYDIETRKVVRCFPGHHGVITDLTWSFDSRWLVTSSMDCTIKTWELPTASLVDCFLLDTAAISIAFSPTSELLATCHIDELGIYLWSNRAIFAHVSLRPLSYDFHPTYAVELPGTNIMAMDQEHEDLETLEPDESMINEENLDYESPEQLSKDLITLSLLPNSRWANLLVLDTIKKRNKPKEPPKVPKSAPFFLPTHSDLCPSFVADKESEEPKSKIIGSTNILELSEFASTLLKCFEINEYSEIMSRLKEMGPSAIDIEIRSLSPDGGGSIQLLSAFLSFILFSLRSRKDYELVQAYMGLFLKVHTECIASEKELIPLVKEIAAENKLVWNNTQRLFNQSMCLVNFLKSATL